MPTHDVGLLSTLVISLVAAFAGGLGMRALGLPPLIGYLAAGIVIGPFTPGVIANQTIANELADIGVALLLFNIGMHFSFKDLLGVRKIAVPGALIQVTFATLLGTIVAALVCHTDVLSSVMIGLALAVASTAVATRVLEERRQVSALSGRVALGWLVVQDMIVIIALVFLPLLGAADTMQPHALLASLGKTALQITGFVFVIGFGGRRFIPALLNYVARSGSRELFTLSVVVTALGIAYGSALVFGVSLALGAFFAGIVIGESDLHHHAASETLSMQQIFTILFFVSIGMLFDPHVLWQKPIEIAALLAVILFGTGFVTFLLLISLRVPLHAAALVGSAFAQIGEFSFVLSALGYESKLFSATERDMIVAVAILSIVINPIILAGSRRFVRFVNDRNLLAKLCPSCTEKNVQEAETEATHAILVGGGRVGSVVAKALREQNFPYIVVESDRILTEKLRKNGEKVIYGDAAREAVLRAAKPGKAKLLIITIPDFYYAQQIIRQARKTNPDIEIIIRTHSDDEIRQMNRLGIGLTVMGERETAFAISFHALQKMGLENAQTRAAVSVLREEFSITAPQDKPASN